MVAEVVSTAAPRTSRSSTARTDQRPAGPTTSRLTMIREEKRKSASSTAARGRTRRPRQSTRQRIATMAIR
jgi:hypothetical protein